MVSLPPKWERFLKRLADDHQIDLNTVVSELCAWAFSDSESKEQFRVWLDEAHPPQKKKLKTRQRLQAKKPPRKKNTKKILKKNPTNTETENQSVRTE